jgi:VIT1/CCC1 family predicted Fe2+/Mn2+ transporter
MPQLSNLEIVGIIVFLVLAIIGSWIAQSSNGQIGERILKLGVIVLIIMSILGYCSRSTYR